MTTAATAPAAVLEFPIGSPIPLVHPSQISVGRVVVLVNGHHRSERAVRVGVQIAARLNHGLTLLTANAAPFSDAAFDRHQVLIAEHRGSHAESVLAQSNGDESTVLMRCLRNDDIVVLAADHVGVVGELFEGSVFMNVLRTFPGVVVAVGPKAVMPDSASVMLVCVDDQSGEQLRLVTEFADPAMLTPELVNVIPRRTAAREEVGSDVIDSGRLRQLAQLWNKRRPHARPATWEVLYGDTVEAIETYADDPRVAAIGLVSMAFGPVSRVISPSLANNLLHRSPRPLVLLSEPPKQVVRLLGE
jgi:nucleotide-binding universal stress UspA family protein